MTITRIESVKSYKICGCHTQYGDQHAQIRNRARNPRCRKASTRPTSRYLAKVLWSFAQPRPTDSVGGKLCSEDKIYCIYIAPNEEMVREHAKQGGFPANRVSEVKTIIDPTTAEKHA